MNEDKTKEELEYEKLEHEMEINLLKKELEICEDDELKIQIISKLIKLGVDVNNL